MTFVIRSMGTSDWNGRDPIVPHHCFLKPASKRAGAWWTRSLLDAEQFTTEEEARATLDALFRSDFGRKDVAPFNADKIGHPPVWA